MVKSIRDSGEFRESKGFGVAGPGLRDDKQKERGRQAGKELKEALQRGKTNIKGTEYTGKLADAMRTANINQFNRRQLRRRALEDAPERLGFGDAFRSIGRGITGLTSQLSPQRVIGSLIGNALLPGIGGLLGGIIGGTYADDDPSNNFFGNIGASLRKDITDTINFFRPEQFVTPPLTESTPSMFPIQNVTATTGMPGMEQIPDMFPDNFGVPSFTPEAAGFGIDSLMQEVNVPANVTDDMMFRAAVTGDPYVDTNFGALTFGPTVFGAEGFKSLEEKGLVPVGVSQNITPAFLRRDR